MTEKLPAELALAAACCRWPPSPEREAAVRAAAARPIDWDRFDRVVARHRVAALARDGLRRAGIVLPAEVERRQAGLAAAAGRTDLAMARETLRLQDMFDQASLPILSVKGATLAMLAYGGLGTKQSWDIDLLTTPDRAADGRRLLLGLGYEVIAPPGLDEEGFARFSGFSKEAVFFNRALNIAVELHWRLIENPHLLPGLDALCETQEVPLAGGSVRTLADDALFAYLCAHGTQHAWFRLKWLADVAAFLARRDQAEVERLYRAALALGAGRTPAVALLLCRRLLGLELPEPLLRELAADRAAGALVATSLRCIAYRRGEAEFSVYSAPGLRTLLSHFRLVPGGRYFRTEMRIKWASPQDRAGMRLPPPLAFLYHVLRVPLWLARVGNRLTGRLTR